MPASDNFLNWTRSRKRNGRLSDSQQILKSLGLDATILQYLAQKPETQRAGSKRDDGGTAIRMPKELMAA